jgi:hypothetical protein
MGTTGINEGHEKTGTGATWQSDGLRDSDILSSASLTNFVERGIYNGVIPISLTNYSQDSGGSDRNNPIAGNCCVRKNTGGTKSFFVDAGTVALDGMFYTVGSASSLDIDTAGLYNARYNAGWSSASLPNAANEECWVLVIADPELAGTNNMGLVCGQKIDVSGGQFPQMPSAHLVKQSAVLAAIRVTNGPVVAAVEDKRVFIRGGPIPLTAMVGEDGDATDPTNDLVSTPTLNAANLPITGLGTLYTRDPAGHSAAVVAAGPTQAHGNAKTHLFYQADGAVGSGADGAYQLTPVHRQHQDIHPYVGAGAVALSFTPLNNEIVAPAHLLEATWFSSNSAQSCALAENVHYSIVGKVLSVLDLATTATNPHTGTGIGPSGSIRFSYTHAGY